MNYPIPLMNKPIQTRVKLPGSKSITYRALLLAALAEGVSEVSDVLLNAHTYTLVDALRELGIIIQLDRETHTCIVAGCGGKFPKREATLQCGDANTVTRFLLAATASSFGNYHFDASSTVRKRSIQSLLQALITLGAKIVDSTLPMQLPLTILGIDGLNGGEVALDPSEKGQFISALLMAAPFAKKPIFIKTNDLLSEPYIEMTSAMMAEFDVLVRKMHRGWFSVPVPQRYRAIDYTIEPDFSLAAYFFAAAAMTGGEVTIQAIDRQKSKQAEIVFLDILEKMGCRMVESENDFTVIGPKHLVGVSVDMRYYSDLVMVLAVLAPFATTPTTITNIGHLRKKEADRIKLMRNELEKLNIKVEDGIDWLKIYPSQPVKGMVESHHYYHIAMAFTLMSLRVPIEVKDSDCINKYYPNFFSLWQAMTKNIN